MNPEQENINKEIYESFMKEVHETFVNSRIRYIAPAYYKEFFLKDLPSLNILENIAIIIDKFEE